MYEMSGIIGWTIVLTEVRLASVCLFFFLSVVRCYTGHVSFFTGENFFWGGGEVGGAASTHVLDFL